MQSDLLVIDGRTVYLSNTEIEGSPAQGAQVEVEGYFTSDGRFIATKVETEDSGSKELDSQPQDSQPENQGDSHDSGGDHSDHEEPETESSTD
jgi:hypothetical protein